MTARSRFAALALLALVALLVALVARLARDADVVPATALAPGITSREDADRAVDPLSEATKDAERAIAATETAPTPSARAELGLEVAADAKATLVVRVVAREDRAPLSGVRLYLSPHQPRQDEMISEPVAGSVARAGESPLSGSDGSARFAVRARTDYRVWASGNVEPGKLRHGQARTDVGALAPGERREIEIALPTRSDARFHGRVVADEDGAPIAGAEIDLVSAGFASRAQVRTLSAEPSDVLPSGRTRAERGEPEARATSAADGSFALDVATWLENHAWIAAPGRSTALFAARPNAPDAPLELRLARAATLTVRALDADEAPIADVSFRAVAELSAVRRGEPRNPVAAPAWQAPAGSDGAAVLVDVASKAALTIELVRDGELVERDPRTYVLAPGETRHVDVRLGGFASVVGRLTTREGVALANERVGASVAIDSRRASFARSRIVASTTTDADGRFAIERLAQGRWWIGPIGPDAFVNDGSRGRRPDASRTFAGFRMVRDFPPIEERLAPIAELVDVPARGRVEVQLRTDRGLALRGRVLDPAGQPAVRVHVAASARALDWRPEATTDDRGRFELGPLVDDEYRVTAASYGTGYASSATALARPGGAEVVLALRTAGVVRCRVPDDVDASSLASALTPRDDEVASGRAHELVRMRERELECRGLAPGRHALFVASSDGRYALREDVEVRSAETTDLGELAFAPGAALRIRGASDRDDFVFAVLRDGRRVLAGRARPGDPVEVVVPPGRIEVRVEGRATPPAVSIRAGERREVVVDALGADR